MNRDTPTFHSNTPLRPILIVCALLMLIIVAAGVAAAAMPPVPYFSQCDSRWGSDKLGGDGPTICDAGCALTSAAMVMAYYGVDTDPERLNDALGRAGYDENYWIYWPAVSDACHDETNQIEYFPGTVKPFDTTVLNAHLDSGHPVIVNVGGHFVVVTGRSDGTYYINDPISSAKSTLDAYPNREGMHIYFGSPPDINKPLVGDWNDNGTDTTGIYNYTTANFSLDSGLNISFGISGDIPITGDWNGNGYDTIGVFRPSTAQFFLDYDNDGVSEMNATFGVIGDIPVAGDWDGDGDDNIGVFRQNHSDTRLTMFFLDLDNSGGPADQSVAFGEPDDLPVIGDWDGDGDDNIGLYRPGTTTGVFYLDIDNDGGAADIVTPEYGDLGDVPIAGDWDGDSDDNIGVYRPGTGEFFLNASMPSVPKTIYVDDDFSDDPSEHRWDTIQEGVDDAADGDTVVVYAGEYVENVDVGKQITLEGGGADVVTVRAADASDDVFYVTADWVSISGFTVTGATAKYSCKAGIRLSSVNRCSISENNALNNYDGIRLYSSNNNILQNNTASNNDNGIRLGDSSNNMLHSNNASNNNHGISLQSSSNNMLTENTMSGNVYNFGVYYSYSLSDNTQNIDTSNTVDGKPIYYWVDQQDKQIPGDAGFVGVVNSTNITVRDLTLTKNVEGVLFAYTENSKIENVTASNNDDYGICLYSSSNNMLTDNTASNNYRGIHLRNSGNNTLMSNNANSNGLHGIYLEGSSCLEDSSNNTLKKNTMSGNRYNFGVRHSLNYPQNIDTSNTVDGKPIYYWVDQEDMTIPDDAGFVGVVNCTNITVRDLILTNNEHGVLFEYTENSRIENVSASNCDEGIELKTHSSNNTVANNTISDNYRGIFLAYSHNNTVVNNTASNNGEGIELGGSNNNTLMDNTASNNRGNGIYLWWHSNNNVLQSNTASNNRGGIELQAHSNNNTLYHNNHLNNTDHNAYDSCTNTWDSGSAGNYYSDYNSIDPDGDGIGNDPHPIPGGTSIDRYPLMQPWAGGTSQKGDLNHDGTLTSADVLIALEIAVSGGYLIGADIDESGYVNALDARMIMQAAAGVTDSL